MSKTFGEKLIMIRQELNMNLSETADRLECVKSNLSRYERNLISPSVTFLKKLFYEFHVNLNWIIGDIGDMFLSKEEIESIKIEEVLDAVALKELCNKQKSTTISNFFYTSFGIPVFTQDPSDSTIDLVPVSGEIAAGEPLEIRNDEPLDFVPFPYYRPNINLDDYLVFRVNGLSMKPEINHQDIIFIFKNNNWDELNHKMVAIVIAGELTLKKLEVRNDLQEIHLIPLNKDFKPIIIPVDQLNQVYLLGELKAIRRSVNR